MPSATKVAINSPYANAPLTNYLRLQKAGCPRAAGLLERLNNYDLLKSQLNDLATLNFVDENGCALYVAG